MSETGIRAFFVGTLLASVAMLGYIGHDRIEAVAHPGTTTVQPCTPPTPAPTPGASR